MIAPNKSTSLSKVESEGLDALYEMLNHYVREAWIVDVMINWHPTIQQVFTKICYLWLSKLAELPEIAIDDRNRASWNFAKKVIDQFPEERFPLI